jgi:hypothetical protein
MLFSNSGLDGMTICPCWQGTRTVLTHVREPPNRYVARRLGPFRLGTSP